MESVSPIRSVESSDEHTIDYEHDTETTSHELSESKPVLGGLRGFIIEKRLARADKKAEKLAVSADAHKESADFITNLVVDESRKGSLKHRDPKPTLSPSTLSERRQLVRNSNRQAKTNTLRSSKQYRLKQIFGDDIDKPEYLERVKSSRMSGSERRKSIQAYKQYRKIEQKADQTENRVIRSAEGKDIPGRVIHARLERAQNKRDRISNAYEGNIEAVSQQSARNNPPVSLSERNPEKTDSQHVLENNSKYASLLPHYDKAVIGRFTDDFKDFLIHYHEVEVQALVQFETLLRAEIAKAELSGQELSENDTYDIMDTVAEKVATHHVDAKDQRAVEEFSLKLQRSFMSPEQEKEQSPVTDKKIDQSPINTPDNQEEQHEAIDWDEVLEPSNIMDFRIKRDANVKLRKEKFLNNNPGARFTQEMREQAIIDVDKVMLPEYLGVDTLDSIDTASLSEELEELRDMLEMEWANLKELKRQEAQKKRIRLDSYDQILES